MEGAHELSRDVISIKNELEQEIHSIGKMRIVNEIKPKPAYSYAHRFIEWVN